MSLTYLMAFCSAPKGWDYTQIRNFSPFSKGHIAREPVSSALKASQNSGREERTWLRWNRSWFCEHWTQIFVGLSTYQTVKGEAKCRLPPSGVQKMKRHTQAQFNNSDWYLGPSWMHRGMRGPPGVGTNHTEPTELHTFLSNSGIWDISGSTWSLL